MHFLSHASESDDSVPLIISTARQVATIAFIRVQSKFVISVLDGRQKNYRGGLAAALGNLGEVIGELFFLDDEKPIFIRLNQPEIVKSLHKQAHPRPRRAHHLRQFFV
jgi:hypothetical protein